MYYIMNQMAYGTNELSNRRITLLLGGLLYPLWYVPYALFVPGHVEALGGRCCVGGLFLGLCASTYKWHWARKHVENLSAVLAVVMSTHYVWLVYLNNLHVAYMVGTFILIVAASSGFNDRVKLGAYFLYSAFMITVLVLIVKTGGPKEIFYLGIMTSMAVCYFAGKNRLSTIDQLNGAKEMLAKSEEAFRSAFDFSAVGIALVDMTERWYKVNPTLIDMLGYSQEEFQQMSYRELTYAEDAPESLRVSRDFVAGRTNHFETEKRYIKKNGELLWVSVTVSSTFDSAKNTVGRVLQVVDISKRKSAEDSARRGQELALQSSKMAALGEMAGGVAHEINTPLASISLLSEQIQDLLADEPLDLEQVKGMTGRIQHTVERIAKIVRGMRFFCRDGSGDAFAPAQLNLIIEDTLALCTEKIKNRGITLMLDVATPASLTIDCRAVEISQVLLNLIGNGFDAIEGLDDKWIRISTKDNGDTVEIAVTDSGRGINVATQKKLFQPFFTTKEIGKGTGLGLSVSQGIVAAHRGTLELDASSTHTRFNMLLFKNQANDALHKAS